MDRRRGPRDRPDGHDRLSRRRPAHTLIAGDDGLDVLCFGENADPPLVHLPRAGVLRSGRPGLLAGDATPTRSSARRRPARSSCPSRRRRPRAIAAFEDTEVDVDEKGPYAWTEHYLSHGAGAVRSGLRHAVIPPGARTRARRTGTRSEHELFHVLEGGGELRLFDRAARQREAAPAPRRAPRLAPGGDRASPTCSAPARRA